MKTFNSKKMMIWGLTMLVAVAMIIFGKGDGQHEGALMASGAAVISLSEVEKAGLNDNEKKMVSAIEKLTNEAYNKAIEGKVSKAEIDLWIKGAADALKNDEIAALNLKLKSIEDAAKQQGTSLTEIENKIQFGGNISKTIAQVLKENEEELKKVYKQGSGNKQFMVGMNNKGEWVMREYDPTAKAAGPHATIADVGTGGNTASIAQSINAASILRMGGDSPIVSQYRNSSWVFDLCNVVNAGVDMPFALWYEEQAKQGASATVAEGATKPLTQYAYTLKSAEYKKEATLIGFTEEFAMDFVRLQDDILTKGRIDVINRINAAVLSRVTAAATAYNTASSFQGGTALTDVNEFDVIAAMAAQVDNATYGAVANTAVMSTFKKYKMGIIKDGDKNYLNRPSVLDNISFIGNPSVGSDDIMVGDFKQYNILLRGGFIVKVGYNGTDFAENRFSVIMEQYYYDYISAVRAVAIVKGADFATVKTALETA